MLNRNKILILFGILAWGMASGFSLGADQIQAEITAAKMRVEVGEEVVFSAGASRSRPDSGLVSYSWDFDDRDQVEEDGTGTEISHVFNETGAYTVKLMLSDQRGRKDEAFCSVEVFPDSDTGPSITSNFEGGKTGLFFESPETFAFRLEWGNQFYFRIDNCRNREVSLRIDGYGPERPHLPSVTPYADDHTFNDRFTLMCTTDYQGHDWFPLEDAEYFYDEKQSSLIVRFKPETDSVYYAWAVPWTMRNLWRLIDRWEGNENFSWRIIGESVEGRPIPALTITDSREDHASKRAVWITGTQHAYEMAAGPVIEGIISRLLEGNGSSEDLLERYVYNIVPIMNPDGVIRGGYRYNMRDIDLNRNWDKIKADPWDSEKSEPEVAAVKKEIKAWVDRHGNLDLFLDFHCLTAIAENLLMIKASPESIPEEVKQDQGEFVSEFLQKRWFFRESESRNTGNANGYIADEYAGKTGVISFTAEHCLGFIRTADGEMERAVPELFRRLGSDYVELIEEYFTKR